MPKTYRITAEQQAEIQEARRTNKNKNVENRLKALELRAEGKTLTEIGTICGYNPAYISNIIARYCNGGLEAIVGNHYKANRRNMSFEEEAELLEPFLQKAEAGQIVEVSEILAAYEEKLGRPINSHGQIYNVLKRHGWRKIMPRSRHPKKASEEEIDSSKKLSLSSPEK